MLHGGRRLVETIGPSLNSSHGFGRMTLDRRGPTDHFKDLGEKPRQPGSGGRSAPKVQTYTPGPDFGTLQTTFCPSYVFLKTSSFGQQVRCVDEITEPFEGRTK